MLDDDMFWIFPLAVIGGLALGVWLGGTPGKMSEIASVWDWIGNALLATLFAFFGGGLAALVLGFVLSLPMALLPGDRMVNFAWSVAFCLWGALCIAMPTAHTWAWLGHESGWREFPYRWTLTESPALSAFISEHFGEAAVQPAGISEKPAPKVVKKSPPQEARRQAVPGPEPRPAAHAQSSDAGAGKEDSIDRDKYLLGIAEAVKAGNHSEAIKLIERLERSGSSVPSAVQYFKAESLLALRRYTEARFAVKEYLRQGRSGRYYEEALKVELAVDRGLDDLRQQWAGAIRDLRSGIAGTHGLNVSWRLSTDYNQEYRCTMSSSSASKVDVEYGNALVKITTDRVNNPSSESRCRVTSGDRARWESPGGLEFDDESAMGYRTLSVPLHRLKDVTVQEKTSKCDGSPTRRWNVRHCPRSMPRYSVISLDGSSVVVLRTGLGGYFSKAAQLFRELGGDVN